MVTAEQDQEPDAAVAAPDDLFPHHADALAAAQIKNKKNKNIYIFSKISISIALSKNTIFTDCERKGTETNIITQNLIGNNY